MEARPRSASIKEQVPLSKVIKESTVSTPNRGSKTPMANTHSSKDKSSGQESLFSNSFKETKQQLGTILEKRKLVIILQWILSFNIK